nr:MAG TPA: hypothetical protein [Caudoviricetes sp.]
MTSRRSQVRILLTPPFCYICPQICGFFIRCSLSSVGRASPSHGGGRGFESLSEHHLGYSKKVFCGCGRPFFVAVMIKL